MSKIDTMNSKSNLDCIANELFNDLTIEVAEIIQGGITGSFRFDSLVNLGTYTNAVGSKIDVEIDSSRFGPTSSNNDFTARLINSSGNTVSSDIVSFNGGTANFSGLTTGASYTLRFTDAQGFDGVGGEGTFTVID